jgi:hypothetical protein
MVNLITQRSNQNPTTKYNVIEEDPSSFFDAENGEDSSDFSEAGGIKRMVKHRRKIQKTRQQRRNVQAKTKGQARIQRTKAKQTQAQSQRDVAKVMGKQDDSAIANALAAIAPAPEVKKSNKPLIIGLSIAGVLVIGGIIAFVIYKKNKK